ncbi:MAG TPA: LURP-one-related family protein [Candidatus Faecousia intestinigallinarum]|nr:LURP-one-related family protein [Candidatus Faecousia intestinigallinarum]
MKLLIRQRVFSWTDHYDVYDENGNAKYEVQAEFLTLGHQIHVYEKTTGREVGSIHQKLLTLMPAFEIVIDGRTVGMVRKQFTLFAPRYEVDFRGWDVQGDLFGWDYQVKQGDSTVMTISKELFRWSDTYAMTYTNPAYEMPGLLLVIAIDAANCSGGD